MSKQAVLEILERAAEDRRFIVQLTEDFASVIKDYDLTWKERAALGSGDIRWIEKHIGKLDKRLRTWLDCRLQQENWYELDMIKERLKPILASYEGKKDELIPILQHVQEEFGYLPERIMLEIAQFTKVPESRVYSVATFYKQFRFTPLGRNHVKVVRGTCGHVKGAPQILEEIEKKLGIREGETTSDMEYTLDTVGCVGDCGLSPCIIINKNVKAKITPKKVAKLFAK
jgi:NADH-quinone oxidoreductase subunit E